MTLRRFLLTASLASVACASPALAQESEWRLRLFGFYMGTGDQPIITDDAGSVLSSDNEAGAGLGLNAEYRLSSRLGLEFGLTVADHGDFRARATGPNTTISATDTMSVTMFTGGLNYDLTPSSPTDVYLGAFLAWVGFGSFDIRYDPAGVPPALPSRSVSLDVDNDVGLGLNLGLDLPLDEQHWILYANLRYVMTSIDGTGAGVSMESVDYDPLMIGIGFGYRF